MAYTHLIIAGRL